MKRTEIADFLVARLERDRAELQTDYAASGPIGHFAIDDVLPPDLAQRIRAAFPAGKTMKTRRSLRELKFIAAQMDRYDPLLEETIYAFQDPRVVCLVGEITGLQSLEPDEHLYAGGISMMVRGHFLNPHLDNSHDKERQRYRVLNLLYYCSPGWSLEHGGNLELWPEGPQGQPITVESRFNRLAVMVTHRQSLHSVSHVQSDVARCCVSNYYFSQLSPEKSDYFHVTSFRGRPKQKVRDLVLRADVALRMAVRKLFPRGAYKVKHYYDKK